MGIEQRTEQFGYGERMLFEFIEHVAALTGEGKIDVAFVIMSEGTAQVMLVSRPRNIFEAWGANNPVCSQMVPADILSLPMQQRIMASFSVML